MPCPESCGTLGFATLKRAVAQFFLFEQRNTTYVAEMRGGLVTFLTMSYILLVNPHILTYWIGGESTDKNLVHMRQEYISNVATSTAAVCAVATLAIGLVTNLPFAVGPGMGMNTFFAGAIIMAESSSSKELAASIDSWKIAVTTTLCAGAILFLASVSSISPRLIAVLPTILKSSIMVGIGVYQAFVGLRTLNIIQTEKNELLKVVSDFDWSDHGATGPIAQILFICCVILTSALYIADVKGAILIGIVLVTVICWSCEVGGVSFPSMPVESPVFDKTFWSIDFPGFFTSAKAIGTCFAFVLVTLFDVGGVMFGVMSVVRQQEEMNADQQGATTGAHNNNSPPPREPSQPSRPRGGGRVVDDPDIQEDGEMDEEDRLVNHNAEEGEGLLHDESRVDAHPEVISRSESQRTFIIIGLSTMLSAVLGCSPTIVFLECAAGVASGARTGFASVVTALLFFASLPFVPLFQSVPLCASNPALLLIGCFMMSSVADIPWNDHKYAMPAFLTIIMMPFTASITPGIVAGIVTYGLLVFYEKYVLVALGYAWPLVKEKIVTCCRRCCGCGPRGVDVENAQSDSVVPDFLQQREIEELEKKARRAGQGDSNYNLNTAHRKSTAQSAEHRTLSAVSSTTSHTHSLGYNENEPHEGPIRYASQPGRFGNTTNFLR